jgi:hypothetical protein
MKTPSALANASRGVAALGVLAVSGGAALAQDTEITRVNPGGLLAMSGFLVVCFVLTVVGYVYMALALQTIATKTKTENPWLAWIPVVNLVLMLNIGRKPLWWLLLMLIPLVNVVVAIMVWMAIAEARGKPGWWGIVLILPLIGIIVPGYLAWSD